MKDIAIIGIAGRFPGADDMDEFYQLLRNGVCTTAEITQERIAATSLPAKEYMPFSYLKSIDRFDCEFFDISPYEAENMDPHQRILLEVAYHAFESTGFSIESWKGSDTGIILSDFVSSYYLLAREFDPTLFTGSLSAFSAGRLARFFDLRGMATMIDTTCSSSLVALHLACRQIHNNEADMMLVGGASLILRPNPKSAVSVAEILSPDGKTNAFSSTASGIGLGEGAGFVVIRELEKAKQAGNIIYAIIKGSAVNQDAQLSGSQTAPSMQAQAMVLKKAWENAGILPESIGYIEAHGTATKLGDPIEVEAMDKAFREYTQRKNFCVISSVKSNIGHTGNIAGLMGLCKAVLSLHHKELFPSVNFHKPNPFIDFNLAAVSIRTELQSWVSEVPGRTAGVSSFGLMGTNCHVVLQEAGEETPVQPVNGPLLFCLSAKSENALQRKIDWFTEYIQKTEPALLPRLSYTLNLGRQHFDYRSATVISNGGVLQQLKAGDLKMVKTRKNKSKKIFLFSGSGTIGPDQLLAWKNASSFLQPFADECLSCIQHELPTKNECDFIVQYAIYKAFEKMGVSSDTLLGVGAGELVVDVLTGETSLKKAVEACHTISQAPVHDLEGRLEKMLAAETLKGPVVFFEMGAEGLLSGGLRGVQHKKYKGRFTVMSADTVSEAGFLWYITEVYLQGYTPDLTLLYQPNPPGRMNIPGYPFEPTRCWIREYGEVVEDFVLGNPVAAATGSNALADALPIEQAPVISGMSHPDNWTETELTVAEIWKAVLKRPTVEKDDDFFRLGGHSLLGARVISRIEAVCKVKLSFKDVYMFSTIESLSKGIDRLKREQHLAGLLPDIRPSGPEKFVELSHAQYRIWIIEQLESANELFLSYNAPYTIRIEGNLDRQILQQAFLKVIQRHEILRTTFVSREGIPFQQIWGEIAFNLEEIDLTAEDRPDPVIERLTRSKVKEKFDLQNGPLIRALIIQKSLQEHVLVFIIHHIISDGWSMKVLMTEISGAYNFLSGETREEEGPLAIQYKDYSRWHNELVKGSLVNAARDYWKEQLKPPLPLLNLPIDTRRSGNQSFSGKTWKGMIDKELTTQLTQLTVKHNASLFMTLVGMVSVLLHKYTGSNDIIVGSPAAGRLKPELEKLIGFFVNTLPIRTSLDAGRCFSDLMSGVKQTVLEALENQLYPFDMLVDELVTDRRVNRNPVFDVMVVLQNNATENFKIGGLTASLQELNFDVSFFDLMFSFWEVSGEILVEINYNADLYEGSTIMLLQQHFFSLIKSIAENPDCKIADLAMISDIEKKYAKEETIISFDF